MRWEFPITKVMHWNLELNGIWVYEREDISVLVRLVGGGVLSVGERGGFEVKGSFGLERWERGI